jgi:hypothetical protein
MGSSLNGYDSCTLCDDYIPWMRRHQKSTSIEISDNPSAAIKIPHPATKARYQNGSGYGSFFAIKNKVIIVITILLRTNNLFRSPFGLNALRRVSPEKKEEGLRPTRPALPLSTPALQPIFLGRNIKNRPLSPANLFRHNIELSATTPDSVGVAALLPNLRRADRMIF